MVASCSSPFSARSPAIAARKPSTIDMPRVAGSRSGSRAKARSRAAPSAARTLASLDGCPVRAAPQPRGDALKTGLAGEVADMLAGDDQFAALAVDMAQHGFGGGNAVQADRGLW